MNLSEEFRKFAAECERIAKLTHDRENKSAWRRMSERWLQNAKSLKKDIPRQSRKTAIESALTLGLTETRARVSSPFFRYERQVDPRLPDCPQRPPFGVEGGIAVIQTTSMRLDYEIRSTVASPIAG
jgi:hypothetical protein